MKLSKNLLLLRQSQGLTQLDVADLAGFSREYVAKIEADNIKAGLSRPYFEALRSGLNTTKEWIMDGLGWAYNPPSIVKALRFIEGCLKINQDSVVIVTYKDGDRTRRGFIFTGPSGTVSMSGSQTQKCPEGIFTYNEALRMIEEDNLPIGHIVLSGKEAKSLSQTDMEILVKKARYGETDLEDI